jgi:hypothetical protein
MVEEMIDVMQKGPPIGGPSHLDAFLGAATSGRGGLRRPDRDETGAPGDDPLGDVGREGLRRIHTEMAKGP